MNDNHRTPDPDDLGDLDDLDLAVVGQLRRTLQTVAAATPVEDRRAALLTAIDASEPPAPTEEDDAMHLDPRTDAVRPIWRRPLFLAAAAALVVAVVGFALGNSRDQAVELDPAQPDPVPVTGWYLPPAGWEITEVRTDFLDMGEVGCLPVPLLGGRRRRARTLRRSRATSRLTATSGSTPRSTSTVGPG